MMHRFSSVLVATALLLSTMPIARAADTAASSSSSAAVETDVMTQLRIMRCKKFAKGDDYERCVRLIRRIPGRAAGETSDSPMQVEASSTTSLDWKWVNILNRIEAKLSGTVKFVSVMATKFCTDQTEDNGGTVRACMSRVKDELKTRIDVMLDAAFRADATN